MTTTPDDIATQAATAQAKANRLAAQVAAIDQAEADARRTTEIEHYHQAAVGGDYMTTGSFYAGSAPALYQDVAAYVPAYNQTVQVGKVQPVGHDDSQPAGSQDTFMLDDSTVAWGQATNPSDGGQITVTKTQTLPGVGSTDDGKSLVDLAAASHPQPTHTWWPWLVIGGVLVIAVGLVAWLATRRKEG
jgi:hypothetical protein